MVAKVSRKNACHTLTMINMYNLDCRIIDMGGPYHGSWLLYTTKKHDRYKEPRICQQIEKGN
jgi:hypothetical protein